MLARFSAFGLLRCGWVFESTMEVSFVFCIWQSAVNTFFKVQLSKDEYLIFGHIWKIIPSVVLAVFKGHILGRSERCKAVYFGIHAFFYFDCIWVKNAEWHVGQRLIHEDRSPEADTFHASNNIFVIFFQHLICEILTSVGKQ